MRETLDGIETMKIMNLRAPPASDALRFSLCLLLVLVLAGCAGAPQPARVFVVRHAEKADGPDPALTPAGQQRAERLAEMLAGEDIRQIFSTDTLRTRSTAKPLAERLGLAVELYDHREPGKLVDAIRVGGGSALVVGHSNTIADIAARFGAAPGSPVADDEYDRLYVIRLGEAVTGEIRRYGD